ncbi:MAG: hypothetical protein JXJ20_10655 [Anaerolineae bacterium]|nr:hypothetical protein [Anaerolineae bacterium]
MPRIKCGPETEVIGQVMLSYIHNLQAELIQPMLKKYGLMDIDPDKWYPLRPWLDLIDELSTQPNFASNMVAVGLKVAEYAIMPPEMKNVTLGQMLEGWNEHFHANHRNGEIGSVVTEKVNDKFYKTIHQHIYPDALNYGLAYGFARAFLPAGTHFDVWYEDNDHRLDNGGGDKTVICVRWE